MAGQILSHDIPCDAWEVIDLSFYFLEREWGNSSSRFTNFDTGYISIISLRLHSNSVKQFIRGPRCPWGMVGGYNQIHDEINDRIQYTVWGGFKYFMSYDKEAPKQRDHYFDNVKFILALLVVIGHAYRPLIDETPFMKTIYLTIYTFHMPLFILISGYFAKSYYKEGQNKKVIATILIPYLIFEILYSLFDHFLYETDSIDFSILEPYWIMWFLFSLFLWRLILPFFVNLKYPLVTSFILAILIGYIDEADRYLSLSRTVAFFPFFLTGYYLQRIHFEKLFHKGVKVVSWIGLTLMIPLIHYVEFHSSLGIHLRKWLYFSYPYEDLGHSEWYAGLIRVALIALALLMSIFFLSIIPKTKTFYSQWGAQSLYIYLLHGFIIRSFNNLNLDDSIPGPGLYIGVTLGAIALTVILASRWVQRLTHPIIQPKVHWIFKQKGKQKS